MEIILKFPHKKDSETEKTLNLTQFYIGYIGYNLMSFLTYLSFIFKKDTFFQFTTTEKRQDATKRTPLFDISSSTGALSKMAYLNSKTFRTSVCGCGIE